MRKGARSRHSIAAAARKQKQRVRKLCVRVRVSTPPAQDPPGAAIVGGWCPYLDGGGLVSAARRPWGCTALHPPHLIRNTTIEMRVSDFLFLKVQKIAPDGTPEANKFGKMHSKPSSVHLEGFWGPSGGSTNRDFLTPK